MFKPKLPQQEQGFTLVEVLVAILLMTLFIATAMEAMALAAVFKARARQYTEATIWIQQNLEETVKVKASTYNDSNKCNATSLNDGYGDGLRDDVTGSAQTNSNYVDLLKTISGKGFRMRRTTTPSSNPPYNVLKVTYDVSPTSGGSSIAKFDTEVIPDAAFGC